MSSDKLYIDCPFHEKDEAKKAGAKWDPTAKQWYIPSFKLNEVEQFNKWKPNGRKYLNCPYKDKDKAKALGAKWDRDLNKWYYVPDEDGVNDADFVEWLNPAQIHIKSISTPTKQEKDTEVEIVETNVLQITPGKRKMEETFNNSFKTPPSKKKQSLALQPRINFDMTLNQLREECLFRNPSIKGISNKDKQWLIDHLGLGSHWLSCKHD